MKVSGYFLNAVCIGEMTSETKLIVKQAHTHLIMAGVREVTDALWEDRTYQHFHLFRVNIGGLTQIPLFYADFVKHLE